MNSTEFQLWEAAWKRLLRDALPGLLVDPETAIDEEGNALTLDHLVGEGRWVAPVDQATTVPPKALEVIRDNAIMAFFGMAPEGPIIPYSKIFQEPKESFTSFVERLTRAIELQTADWTVTSVNFKEQGAWPVAEGEFIVIGDCKHTPQEIEILPGTLVNNPGRIALWLRCTHPPTYLPKNQIVDQIIPTRGSGNISETPKVCPVQAITEERPRVECEFSVGGEALHITGLLDTGADVTVVPEKDWPSHWALQNVAGHVQV
ncbi:hypothetical protein DUI87_12867 [Hirundo rustica rustica]|uniref:Peptidase A2 domain-containing protein n=1 Tax=Hirundo rustica rustica TaxID=333673 RepID=A0A3M0KA70_HIRRU|nr:hypothetical protein DUI87_12867 [Hirundo rustica rustica]